MGFFFEGYSVTTILTVVLLVAALISLNHVTRHSKMLSIVMY